SSVLRVAASESAPPRASSASSRPIVSVNARRPFEIAIQPKTPPGNTTINRANTSSLVRSDGNANVCQLSALPPRFRQRFMTASVFQISKQMSCRLGRPAAASRFAWVIVAVLLVARAAFAEDARTPELPQPEERPVL